MLVGDKLSHDAASEAYILLTAYIREEGKVATTYDANRLTEFVGFLAEILKNPDNFSSFEKKQTETVKELSDQDVVGLA
jgi:hypothetical protein